MTQVGSYKKRGLLNYPDLKVAVCQRFEARKRTTHLPQVIEDWMMGPYMRWLSKECPFGCLVTSRSDAMRQGLGHIPDWADAQFSGGVAALHMVPPHHPDLIRIEERLLEWLTSRIGTRDERKFARMTAPQILAKWEWEHVRRAERVGVVRQTATGMALRTLLDVGSLVLYELIPGPEFRQEMLQDAAMMQHCLGLFEDIAQLTGGYGGYFAAEVEAGRMRFFSFRTETGQAHITMTVHVHSETGDLQLDQLKGKQNIPPAEKYLEAVTQALETLEIRHDFHPDTLAMKLVGTRFGPRGFGQLDRAAQIGLVARRPDLIDALESPPISAFWLAQAAERKPLDVSAPKSLGLAGLSSLMDAMADEQDKDHASVRQSQSSEDFVPDPLWLDA